MPVIPEKREDIILVFGGISEPYVKSGSPGVWVSRRYFLFRGTNVLGEPVLIKFIARAKNHNSDYGEIRLYDETNGAVIALVSNITADIPTIYEVSPANLSSGEAILRVDLQKVTDEIHCHAVAIIF